MPQLNPVRAVTFDVGGTLIEPWPSVGHVYAQVTAQLGGARIAPEVLNQRFASAWTARRGFDYTRAAWRELVNRTFAGLGPLTPGCFEAIYDQFGRAQSWRVFDDVWPALTALKARGFKLGVVSNWDERLPPLLEETGLARHFDAMIISHEAGYAKPSVEIFHLAAHRLGIPIEFMLHVGDSLAEDIAGARASGAPAVLLARGGTPPGRAAVRNLDQLVSALVQASTETPGD
jgi:putative hydrolase of the HAD superfamily